MGRLTKQEVVRRTEDALRRMLPDRASRLLRGLKVAFWTGAEGVTDGSRCRYCGRSAKKTGPLVWRMACAECVELAHEISIEREAGTPPAHRDAVLADAARALRAVDARADEVVRELETLLGAEPPAAEPSEICSRCVARARDVVAAPGVRLCRDCIRLAMHALSKDRAAGVASGETHGLTPRGIWTRTARALEPVAGARTPRLMMEIERWFWRIEGTPVAARCSTCNRGRDATGALVVCAHRYDDWEYPYPRYEVLRSPRWDRGWQPPRHVLLTLCETCVAALATWDAEHRAGAAMPDPREVLAQAGAALRAGGAAQAGEIGEALEAANAGIDPVAIVDGGDCRVCGWRPDRLLVWDRTLRLCMRCVRGARDALAE